MKRLSPSFNNLFKAALIAPIFLAASAFAQDFDAPPSPSSNNGGVTSQTLLPDLTNHPLICKEIEIEISATDGLGKTTASKTKTKLPLPVLNNPIGYKVLDLRCELAFTIEETKLGEDGLPLPDEVYRVAMEVAKSFENFMNSVSVDFQRHETLVVFMNKHHKLLDVAESKNFPELVQIIDDLKDITKKLEDDLLPRSEIALRDAREALEEALNNGADNEFIEQLNKALEEAMKDYMEDQMQNQQLSAEDRKILGDMQKHFELLKKILEEMGLTLEDYAKLLSDMASQMQSKPPATGTEKQQADQGQPDFAKMLEEMKKKILFMQKMVKYIKDLNAIIDSQQELRDETSSLALEEGLGNFLPPEEDKAKTLSLGTAQRVIINKIKAMITAMTKDEMDVDKYSQALTLMEQALKHLQENRKGDAVLVMDEILDQLNDMQNDAEAALAQAPGAGSGGNESGNSPFGQGPGGDLKSDTPLVDGEGNFVSPSVENDLDVKESEQSRGAETRKRLMELQGKSDGSTGPSDHQRRLLGIDPSP